MEIFERVAEIIADELTIEVEDISLDSDLTDDLGADSLDAIELIMSLEDEFDVEIDDQKLAKVKTVSDIVDLIEEEL